MKKILAVLLVAILAIGCFALTGCGDATFGGNYEEATVTDVQAFADAAALAQGKDEIDFADGYEIYLDIYAPTDYMTIDAVLNMKIKAVDGKLQMAGTMNATMSNSSSSQKTNGNCYWVDGMCYESGNVTMSAAGQTMS